MHLRFCAILEAKSLHPDFRDEVMAQIYDRGDPSPKRPIGEKLRPAFRAARCGWRGRRRRR